ncbi:MAG: TlyA family RNA methyltransferase [Alphaproteobacteria bacterium]|nr:TlyA family RNA methyltransferase [Alphaproteobacteria bacterium]
MTQKQRLDLILVARGLAPSRAKAQAMTIAGLVWSGDRRLDKPGQMLPPETPLECRGKAHPFVSRGGVKLTHGLDQFAIDPAGATALDIGASTGGFTDVLLRRGARRVYAVDVGHGQLDWRLRQDPRVVVRERCNARHLTSAEIPEPVDLITCDASFIGLRTVLPAAVDLAAPVAALVALIKPQFEVGKARVGKGGIVREAALHDEVCTEIAAWLGNRTGWRVVGIAQSPISGADGNVEFLIGARRGGG